MAKTSRLSFQGRGGREEGVKKKSSCSVVKAFQDGARALFIEESLGERGRCMGEGMRFMSHDESETCFGESKDGGGEARVFIVCIHL